MGVLIAEQLGTRHLQVFHFVSVRWKPLSWEPTALNIMISVATQFTDAADENSPISTAERQPCHPAEPSQPSPLTTALPPQRFHQSLNIMTKKRQSSIL